MAWEGAAGLSVVQPEECDSATGTDGIDLLVSCGRYEERNEKF